MNRYLQKILEIKFHFLSNLSYSPQVNNFVLPIIRSTPLISVVIPIYRPQISWLKDCLESVINQTYQNWELILVDDFSDSPQIDKILTQYSSHLQIKIIRNPKNLNIVRTTNIGCQAATGEWIVFFDHDDYLWPNCLSEIASAIESHPKTVFIYTDSDKINSQNKHFDPFFKPDYSEDLLQQTNYINHLSIIKSSSLKKLNYLRQGTDGAQDWDLLLRLSKITSNFTHIPKILYSWRSSPTSTASDTGIISQKDKILSIQKEVLKHNLRQPVSPSRYLGIWSINHQSTILPYQFHLRSLIHLIRHKQ